MSKRLANGKGLLHRREVELAKLKKLDKEISKQRSLVEFLESPLIEIIYEFLENLDLVNICVEYSGWCHKCLFAFTNGVCPVHMGNTTYTTKSEWVKVTVHLTMRIPGEVDPEDFAFLNGLLQEEPIVILTFTSIGTRMASINSLHIERKIC